MCASFLVSASKQLVVRRTSWRLDTLDLRNKIYNDILHSTKCKIQGIQGIQGIQAVSATATDVPQVEPLRIRQATLADWVRGVLANPSSPLSPMRASFLVSESVKPRWRIRSEVF